MGGDTGVPLLSVFPFNFFSLNNILGSSTSCSILLLVLFLFLFQFMLMHFTKRLVFIRLSWWLTFALGELKSLLKKKLNELNCGIQRKR